MSVLITAALTQTGLPRILPKVSAAKADFSIMPPVRITSSTDCPLASISSTIQRRPQAKPSMKAANLLKPSQARIADKRKHARKTIK